MGPVGRFLTWRRSGKSGDDADATTTMATLRRASAQPTTALAEAVTSGLGHLDDGTLPPRLRRELHSPLRNWQKAAAQHLAPRHEPDARHHDRPRRR